MNWNVDTLIVTPSAELSFEEELRAIAKETGKPEAVEFTEKLIAAGLANAVRWMQLFLDTLSDKAVWAVPRSGSVIQVDKVNKRAVRLLGAAPETSIQKVFEAMGWTWEDKS